MKQTTSETCVEYPSRVFGEPFVLIQNSVEPLATGGETIRSPKKKRSMVWMSLQEFFRSAGRHYLILSEARANGWTD
jgi:hypothetical protein